MSFTDELKTSVQNHPVLKSPWLISKTRELKKKDLLLWLSQEYFVSVDFVNWFLFSASLTNDVSAKSILVENIWEELGEGRPENSHVSILVQFLNKLGIKETELKILYHTKKYLDTMQNIVKSNILAALGALGPANEYLLSLEYGAMHESYKILKQKESLPEGKFFQVNLEADDSHSAKLFSLIEAIAKSESDKKKVMNGNIEALDARTLFYDGLMEMEK